MATKMTGSTSSSRPTNLTGRRRIAQDRADEALWDLLAWATEFRTVGPQAHANDKGQRLVSYLVEKVEQEWKLRE